MEFLFEKEEDPGKVRLPTTKIFLRANLVEE